MRIELERAEFGRQLREAKEDFLQKESVIRIQHRTTADADEGLKMLERATRRFLLDRLLLALDWDPDEPDSVTEEGRGWGPQRQRFYFDYVGVVPATQKAVLLFEAKGYDVTAPRKADKAPPLAREMAALLAEALDAMHRDETPEILGEWQGFLQDLKDYVEALDRDGVADLKRVAISSGKWLIVFEDPENAFLSGKPDADLIKCFPTLDEVVDSAEAIHSLLHRRQLVDTLPTVISIFDAIRYVIPAEIDQFAQGVLIKTDMTGLKRAPVPNRQVYPAIIVMSKYRSHAIVDYQPVPEPEDETGFPKFLEKLRQRGEGLARSVGNWAQREVSMAALDEFAGFEAPRSPNNSIAAALAGSTNAKRPADPECRRLVKSDESDAYLVVTGAHWYYKHNGSDTCNYHSRYGVKQEGISLDIAVPRSKTSLTEDGQSRHCAHGLFVAARQKAGCHVAHFETNMCCPGCIFFADCWSVRSHPKLPCPAPHDAAYCEPPP